MKKKRVWNTAILALSEFIETRLESHNLNETDAHHREIRRRPCPTQGLSLVLLSDTGLGLDMAMKMTQQVLKSRAGASGTATGTVCAVSE